MKYAGEQTDPTGLYHLRARQYDPTTGRLGARDPLETEVGQPMASLYAYVRDQPTLLFDPSGLRWCKKLCPAVDPVGAASVAVAKAVPNGIEQATRAAEAAPLPQWNSDLPTVTKAIARLVPSMFVVITAADVIEFTQGGDPFTTALERSLLRTVGATVFAARAVAVCSALIPEGGVPAVVCAGYLGTAGAIIGDEFGRRIGDATLGRVGK